MPVGTTASTVATASSAAAGMLPTGIILVLLGLGLGFALHWIGYLLAAVGVMFLISHAFSPRARVATVDVDPLRARADALRQQASVIAREVGQPDGDALLAAHTRFESERATRDSLARQLGQLLGEEPTPDAIDRFRAQFAGQGTELLARDDALRGLETADLLPEVRALAFSSDVAGDDLAARQAIRRLEDQVASFDERLEGVRLRATELGALARQPGPTHEQIAAIEERLDTTREQQAIWERRLAAVDRAIATIDATRTAVMSSVAEHLAPTVAGRLHAVTGGRYGDIRIDPTSLAIAARVPDGSEYVPADSLSRGTRDQVFMAARLALIDHVCNGRQPPVLIDDGLVSFDLERAHRMMADLRAFAVGRQVILFTWSDRYDSDADQVVVLEGPPSGD
jgi:DNA repair exonuclease SbcCD ATPase subunit